jgi:hypothetical protein
MDYQVETISKTCHATGEDLVPGSVCHSVLAHKEGKLTRIDFSQAGWNGPPDNTVGHWKSLVPHPETTKKKPLDADALLQYFEQLTEDANPARETLRYVLALLLIQKRRLKLDGSRYEDDVPFLELTGSHGEGPFQVRDQHLDPAEIEQLQHDLDAHLQTG